MCHHVSSPSSVSAFISRGIRHAHGLSQPRGAPAALVLAGLVTMSAACTEPSAEQSGATNGRVQVVATTSLVGDIAAQVGGDDIDLEVLLPRSADAHTFDPTPSDLAAVADAEVVFVNGLGLETFLDDLLNSAGGSGSVIRVSDGIEPLYRSEDLGHSHDGPVDPHAWFDPIRVTVWVDNIEAALAAADPDRTAAYAERAAQARARLHALDDWTRERTQALSGDRRRLVADHLVLGYFADRYDFEIVGAVTRSLSSASEPSAAELRDLVEAIRAEEVPAIFIDVNGPASVAGNVASEAGIPTIPIYTGSLSDADGPAATYDAFMRHNVGAIVDALSP